MQFSETSTKGSAEISVNGKKVSYKWDGEMTSAPNGYNLRADADVNGKKLHLDLKDKSQEELKGAMVTLLTNFRTKVAKRKRLASRKAKKHLNRRSRR